MKDFYSLRECLQNRLPGLFIPSLPPKTVMAPTDQQSLEERAFHLEQFMKKIYKLSYIKESDEMAVFARYVKPVGQADAPDFQKKITTMPPQNAAMLAFRIKCACPGLEVSNNFLRLKCTETTEHP